MEQNCLQHIRQMYLQNNPEEEVAIYSVDSSLSPPRADRPLDSADGSLWSPGLNGPGGKPTLLLEETLKASGCGSLRSGVDRECAVVYVEIT